MTIRLQTSDVFQYTVNKIFILQLSSLTSLTASHKKHAYTYTLFYVKRYMKTDHVKFIPSGTVEYSSGICPRSPRSSPYIFNGASLYTLQLWDTDITHIRERGSVLYLGMATEILNLPYLCITRIMAIEATNSKPSMQRE